MVVELINDGYKYVVQVTRSGPETYFLIMNGSFKEVDYHRMSDGGTNHIKNHFFTLKLFMCLYPIQKVFGRGKSDALGFQIFDVIVHFYCSWVIFFRDSCQKIIAGLVCIDPHTIFTKKFEITENFQNGCFWSELWVWLSLVAVGLETNIKYH